MSGPLLKDAPTARPRQAELLGGGARGSEPLPHLDLPRFHRPGPELRPSEQTCEPRERFPEFPEPQQNTKP